MNQPILDAVASAALILVLVAIPTNLSRAEMADARRIGDSQFTPEKEAELPKGFPSHTKVGAIEVKQYPAYRKATSRGRTAFLSLFKHISKNDIAMTAPVELTYGERNDGSITEENMAFLYGRPQLGRVGKDGAIEVTDVPPGIVVSTGVRGPRTEEAVTQALSRLRTWIDARKSEYAAAGPPRVMAYNSPFVPRDRQFFEVQIPLKSER